MCGICGIIDLPDNAVSEATVRVMTESLTHRGPDAEGFYFDGSVGLGHRRLKVIDLEGGQQPMCSEDENLWLVFNGEIYNYQELSQELRGRGHKFCSKTDSEVVLHLYEEMGSKCVDKLSGMFSFLIWDKKNQKAFFGNDRAGQKPFYYIHDKGRLVFASELGSFAALQDFEFKVEPWALDYFISLQYIPYPWTIFNGIRKLSPGHRGQWLDGEVSIERYWQLRLDNKLSMRENEWIETIVPMLEKAVRQRMVSDVPLGAFLSGGLDSSIITCLMSRNSDRPVKTFSVGFDEASFNELPYAALVARRFGTDHTEFKMPPPGVDDLEKILSCFDEPFADSSAIPTYMVSKMAREHVTVALSGDGGDEAFGGYDRYRGVRLAQSFDFLPKQIRKLAGKMRMFLPKDSDRTSFIRKARRFLWGMHLKPERRYADWMSIFIQEERRNLYAENFRQLLPRAHSESLISREFNRVKLLKEDVVDRVLFVDFITYLPGDLLTKVDRASMGNSLEVRSPFLDHELLELCLRMPTSMKIRGKLGKYILRKAFEGKLPAKILSRRKKGFGVPISNWIRGNWRDFVKDVLLDKQTVQRGYFRQSEVFRIMCEHFEGRSNFGFKIWTLFVLELWQRRWDGLVRKAKARLYQLNAGKSGCARDTANERK